MRYIVSISLVASFLFLSGTLSPALAFVDSQTSVLARSYIPGLSLSQAFGYNQKIWGATDNQSPWYGYIRPYAFGSISPSNYDLRAGLEFFPVSILGLDIRKGSQQRFMKSLFKDCSAFQCQGKLEYQEMAVIGFFGFQNFVGSVRVTHTDYASSYRASETLYDSVNGILLAGDKDQGSGLQFAIFRKDTLLGPFQSLGYLYQRNFYEERNQTRQGHYVLAETERFTYESYQNLKWTLGLGTYDTSSHVPEFSVVLALTYVPVSALGWGR